MIDRVTMVKTEPFESDHRAKQALIVWVAFLVLNILLNGTIPFVLGSDLKAWTVSPNKTFLFNLVQYGLMFLVVPLKITSRFSLMKIGGDAAKCNDCGACVRMCPMDIRVPEYILNKERVLSTECSLCQTCITVCAPEALKLSFGFDVGGKEFMRERVG